MYIFERKNKYGSRLQLMESEYNKDKKRSENTMIASLDGHLDHVTDELKETLTEEQIKCFQDFLDERAKLEKVSRNQTKLSILKNQILTASRALDAGIRFEDEDVNKDPEEVFAAIDELKKAMRKAGYKRAKKPARKTSVDDQPALFEEPKAL